MKRSTTVELVLVIAAAAAIADCNSDRNIRRCIDENNLVADTRNCVGASPSTGHYYHWFYGGSHSFVPVGASVTGGSSGAAGEGASSTAHGVIGSAGAAHAGGGGE